MRKIIIRLLDITGIMLLVSAGIVGWYAYNPPEAIPPPDVTVITETSPRELWPQTATTSPGDTPGNAPVPAVLPETKVTAAPEKALEELRDKLFDNPEVDSPNRTDRIMAYQALAESRAKAFPPPAHALPERIVLPSIKVDSPVKEVGWKVVEDNGQLYSEWEVADYAVGFHHHSALPGAIGNTVMAGHNNINGEVFRHLIDLKIGDEIFVFADQKIYRYTVAQKLLVKERGVSMQQRLQNAAWMAPTDDVRLTLISCWPYTSNTHRVIVVAKPADSG